MKILALEKDVPGVTDDQFTDDILKAEARKAWELQQSGVLRELYFTADTYEAVLVLECESADEARRQLSELPLMWAGLIDFRVIPLVASGNAELHRPVLYQLRNLQAVFGPKRLAINDQFRTVEVGRNFVIGNPAQIEVPRPVERIANLCEVRLLLSEQNLWFGRQPSAKTSPLLSPCSLTAVLATRPG